LVFFLRRQEMVRQFAIVVCVVSMLSFATESALCDLDLKVDIGCPGQEGSGNLKAGWTAFDGTACSGSVGPVIPQSLWPFKGWWYVMAPVLASGHNGIISVGLRLRNAD
jgi:hypothetical protein